VHTLRFVALVNVAFAAASLLVLGCVVTQPVASATRVGPAVQIEPERLEASVRALAERFSPRDSSHVANLDAAAAWIRAELESSGAAISEQTWQADGETYRNVVARFGSHSPDAELVVVGAHYDVCDPLPGADDDASGVAALLELARALAASPPPGPVELVAYSLEEPPYYDTPQMGSVQHAQSLVRSGARVRAMLSLEMLGFFSDEPGSQSYLHFAPLGWLYPDRGDFIGVIGNLGQGSLVRRVKRAMRAAGGPVSVESINAPAWIPGIDFSDHRSYWAEDYPAVMITDTAFLRNPNYHRETDTPETLDYARLAAVTAAVHEAVWALAAD
jgi:hypothetical protein